MKTSIVLLISGKMGSGKTTLQTSVMQAWSKYKFHRAIPVNFADPLYTMHNFIIGYLEDHGIKRELKKDGPLLQVLGTEWGRNTVDPDLWVKLTKARMGKFMDPTKNLYDHTLFVVGDCRFKNEFDFFDDALRVRLECPRDLRQERCEMWRPNENHASEIDLDEYAQSGKFDLILNTAVMGIEDCTSLVMARLLSMKDLEVAHGAR